MSQNETVKSVSVALARVAASLEKHGNPEPAIPDFGEFDAGYRAGRRALRSIIEAELTAITRELSDDLA